MKTKLEQNFIDWLDPNELPFNHRYFNFSYGKMPYIDEGKGETVVFVHGTPTWSFLYSNYIKFLSTKYRCLAIDHLDFGLSDKPKDFIDTSEAHAKNFTKWIEALRLEKFTLIFHDFGEPNAKIVEFIVDILYRKKGLELP